MGLFTLTGASGGCCTCEFIFRCKGNSAGIDFSRQILTTKVDPRAVRVKG